MKRYKVIVDGHEITTMEFEVIAKTWYKAKEKARVLFEEKTKNYAFDTVEIIKYSDEKIMKEEA